MNCWARAANLASAVSNGFRHRWVCPLGRQPFAAGANTPLAGVISAALMALVVRHRLFHHCPRPCWRPPSSWP